MLKKKADLVREKLLRQASLVLAKLKPFRSSQDKKEVTNQEVQIMLYQYSSSENANFSDDEFDRIHSALSKLDNEQMEVLKRRYWGAESFGVIGNALGHFGHAGHKWASRKEAEALSILAKELGA